MAPGGRVAARMRGQRQTMNAMLVDDVETTDREAWIREHDKHWEARFGDPLDNHAAQHRFHMALLARHRCPPFQACLGSVVLALALASRGTSGGSDGVVNEMLQTLPWTLVVVIAAVFNARFNNHRTSQPEHDIWRRFLVRWIKKDSESRTFGSLRPIVRASCFWKWLERVLLPPDAMDRLCRLFPVWGFRPGLNCDMMTLAFTALLQASMRWTPNNNEDEGAATMCCLFVDVEKAFDCTTLPAMERGLEYAGVSGDRIVAILREQLASWMDIQLGDVTIRGRPHARGKQGGCSTPLLFTAALCALVGPCFSR